MPQDGLAQVLRQLAPFKHPDLLVGAESYDDAGVFRIGDDLALVQTTDFFPPLVDDPYQFGQIAAANALSDVYAMGGEPLTALNIVGFPDQECDPQWLVDILRGGADKVREAGAVIVGGHSVRDREIKYGLAITGRVHPQRIWTNAGARTGDLLVLTKPLGSGVLCNAAKAERIATDELAETVSVMTTLNRAARDAGVQVGVNGCTDITGFGLLGHAFELAEASQATLSIHAGAVPLLPRALEFARLGLLTRASRTTRSHLGPRLEIAAGVEDALVGVLADAQTSGGLLMSIPASRWHDLQRAAERLGLETLCAIGEVHPASATRIQLID